MSESLFQITSALKEVEETIMNNDGELGEQEEAMLTVLSNQLTTKTDGVVEYVDSQQMIIHNIDERIIQLKSIQTKISKRLEVFNKYVLSCMDQLKLTKIEGEIHSVLIRKPSIKIEIVDEGSVDLKYISTKTVSSIDKSQMKKDLKIGKDVNGAILILGERKITFK